VTNRPYSGCNVVLLWMAANAGYRTPRYLTFKHSLELGGNVRKGEHGTKVYFVKQLQVADRDGEEGETRIVPMMREITVFNIAQCERLPERVLTLGEVRPAIPTSATQRLMASWRAAAPASRGVWRGVLPAQRWFHQPAAFEAFKSAAHFYGTAFHELGHWTGHKSRLDRDLRHRFGESAYAAEELVAELCAAFLCAEFSIDGDLRHAGYIQTWIGLLRADSRAFFTACNKAQAAADYLRGLALAERAEIAAWGTTKDPGPVSDAQPCPALATVRRRLFSGQSSTPRG
jgi:antirestriction protein ArdC